MARLHCGPYLAGSRLRACMRGRTPAWQIRFGSCHRNTSTLLSTRVFPLMTGEVVLAVVDRQTDAHPGYRRHFPSTPCPGCAQVPDENGSDVARDEDPHR
jgi:hypothetical protein